MNENRSNASVSSSSSLNSSVPDTEDDHTIAALLAEGETPRAGTRLGKRLSHLDSIPVCDVFIVSCFLFDLNERFRY